MKKNLILATIIASTSLLLISFASASRSEMPSATASITIADSSITDDVSESSAEMLAATLFNKLNLGRLGLAEKTILYAVNGYQKLEDNGQVRNQYLTIIDMGQSSRRKRMYIIDMEKQELVWNTFVSHGKNSGVDMATKFSNAFNSHASSLGFYVTSHTYHGKHGLSLRLKGQETGFNNNAEARGVVVHGADYVNSGRVNSAYMGRSQGCPALPMNEYRDIINIIKDGSVMFIYHPSKNYLQSSNFING